MDELFKNALKNMPGADILEKAQRIIVFEEDYMSKPYIATTQNQRYLTETVPKDAKSACVILGAGDTIFQILSQYANIEKIVAVENNELQKVVFKLRKAALKALSNKEYEMFLLDKECKEFLSHEVYKNVMSDFAKDEEAEKNFWDVFLKLNPLEDILQYFIKGGLEQVNVFKMRYGLPYLKRRNLFYSVKEGLEKVKIDIVIKDALKYFEENPEAKFDYIDITNILIFIYQLQCEELPEKFSECVKRLRNIYEKNLNKGGTLVLDYMFGISEAELKASNFKETDILAQKTERIYKNIYEELAKEFDLEIRTAEALCSPMPLKGNSDTILFTRK